MIEVKVCDNCKHNNSVITVECEKCGYDLTFVFPQMIEEKNEIIDEVVCSERNTANGSNIWEMVYSTNESIKNDLTCEVEVGRDCDLFNEQFNASNYTSRIHAKIRVLDETVQVMDASTNGTFVNDKRIPKMEWISVSEGTVVKFADVAFVFRRKANAD